MIPRGRYGRGRPGRSVMSISRADSNQIPEPRDRTNPRRGNIGIFNFNDRKQITWSTRKPYKDHRRPLDNLSIPRTKPKKQGNAYRPIAQIRRIF